MTPELEKAVARRLGSTIAGKYELKRVLGVGGMGAVYAALHTFTGRAVALKLLHEDFAQVSTVARRFLQEARATIGLDHPSIIEVLDAGQEADGQLYVVFEMLEGEPLSHALQHERLTFE